MMILVDFGFCIGGFVLELEILCGEYLVYCDFICVC